MATRPNNEERGFGDRERQREISNEGGRSARATGGEGAGRTENASESGSAQRLSNRGFASMDRSKQREIASKGGRAAHQKGTAHEFDSSEARAAGRKGGVTVSRNREHMAAIGRRGGEARGANRAARLQQNGDANANASTQRFSGDREVGISANTNGQASASSGSQGTARQSGNSLGGERRPASSDERSVERP